MKLKIEPPHFTTSSALIQAAHNISETPLTRAAILYETVDGEFGYEEVGQFNSTSLVGLIEIIKFLLMNSIFEHGDRQDAN